MRTLKFCMVTTFYPPYHFGGDATYVRALSEALVARGHEVTVVHCEDAFRLKSGDGHLVEPESEVRVERLKSTAGFLSPLLTQQLGLPALKSTRLRQILSRDFDVVNFHNVSLVGGPGVLQFSRAPVTLYTLHEHWLICPTHIFWKNKTRACDSRQCIRCSVVSGVPPQLWRYTSLLKRSLGHVDHFISPSEYTAARHIEDLDLKGRVSVLPLFSNLSPPSEADAGADSKNGEFLYVGRVTAAKGVRELVQSFLKRPDYSLTLVGEGDLLEALRAECSDAPNITFAGAVAQSELLQFYQAATALIMPSLAPETFGLTVVEAFACSTPAIVRVAGGNREAIDNSGAGYLYQNEDELLLALDDIAHNPSLRASLGKKARKAYETLYTVERHLDRYLTLVHEVQEHKVNTAGVG